MLISKKKLLQNRLCNFVLRKSKKFEKPWWKQSFFTLSYLQTDKSCHERKLNRNSPWPATETHSLLSQAERVNMPQAHKHTLNRVIQPFLCLRNQKMKLSFFWLVTIIPLFRVKVRNLVLFITRFRIPVLKD